MQPNELYTHPTYTETTIPRKSDDCCRDDTFLRAKRQKTGGPYARELPPHPRITRLFFNREGTHTMARTPPAGSPAHSTTCPSLPFVCRKADSRVMQ